jgi:MoxR-like ATPase
VRQEIGRVIFGQERVVDETLITILAGGHVLLVGVPGLAKTLLRRRSGGCSACPRSGCSSPPT